MRRETERPDADPEMCSNDPAAWLALIGPLHSHDELVAVASRGAASPEWQQLRNASFWPRMALLQLAHEAELRELMREPGVGTGPRVLEIGCGAGMMSRLLMMEGAAGVDGLERDTSAKPLWDRVVGACQADQVRFHTGRLAGPYENDALNWPHCDGLKWPHLRPIVA